MHGFALAFLGLAVIHDPLELPKDVYEIQALRFAIPLRVDPKSQDKIDRIGLHVSVDQGKTWKHLKDCKPSDDDLPFKAEADGLYWFALQVHLKDGTSEPTREKELVAAMKVFVNSERKALKPQWSNEELQREVEELRKTIEKLQKRIKELEGRKPE